MPDIDFSILSTDNLTLIKKGSYILRQGEEKEYLYYLKEGICYISSETKDGSENIYWYFKKGDFPCISPVLTEIYPINLSNIKSDMNIIAKTDCYVYTFSRENFIDLFRKNPDFAWNVTNVLIKQMNLIVCRYHVKLNFNTPSRVCYGLLDLADKKIINGKEQ